MSTTTHRPRTYATVTGPHATFVTLDGHAEPVTPTADEDIRHAVVRRATDEARRTGTPIELVTSGDRGEHHLLIDPAGDLSPSPPSTRMPRGTTKTSTWARIRTSMTRSRPDVERR